MRKLDYNSAYQSQAMHDLDEVMDAFTRKRKELGLTQQEIADLTGVSVSTVSKYERGLYPTRVVWLGAIMRGVYLRIDNK